MGISHTPGPWEAHGSDDGRGITWTVGRPEVGKHYTLARIYRPQGGNEQKAVAIANARLIAAAPELLDALETVMTNMRTGASGQIARQGWAKARGAISKATSRQPEGER